MNEQIEKILGEFQKSGRYFERPFFSTSQISSWEKELNANFPECYKDLVTAGSFDADNVYFLEPYREFAHPGFTVFARWNNNFFAFNEEFREIFMIQEDNVTKIFDSFPDWVTHIYKMTNAPVNPE